MVYCTLLVSLRTASVDDPTLSACTPSQRLRPCRRARPRMLQPRFQHAGAAPEVGNDSALFRLCSTPNPSDTIEVPRPGRRLETRKTSGMPPRRAASSRCHLRYEVPCRNRSPDPSPSGCRRVPGHATGQSSAREALHAQPPSQTCSGLRTLCCMWPPKEIRNGATEKGTVRLICSS